MKTYTKLIKIEEKFRGCPYKISYIADYHCPSVPNLVPKSAKI